MQLRVDVRIGRYPCSTRGLSGASDTRNCQPQRFALATRTSRHKRRCARRREQAWSSDHCSLGVVDSVAASLLLWRCRDLRTKQAAQSTQRAGIMNVMGCPAGAVVGSDGTTKWPWVQDEIASHRLKGLKVPPRSESSGLGHEEPSCSTHA